MNFLQRTPFFRLLLPLICGIVTAQYLLIYNLIIILLLSLSVLLMACSFLMRKGRFAYSFRWIFGVAALLFLFLTGYIAASVRISRTTVSFPGEKAVFQLKIIETPDIRTKTVACKAELLSTDSVKLVRTNPLVIIYIKTDSMAVKLRSGDVLLVNTLLQPPPPALNPKAFDYRKYLRRKGIAATGWVPAGRWQLIGHQDAVSLKKTAETSRQKLLDLFHSVISTPGEYAVLAALTMGYKDALDQSLQEDYSHSGAMHILSVSGLHVGVIYMILNLIFSFLLKKSKILNTIVILSFLWIYAIITGLSPSVIRAAAMFSLVSIGAAIDRKSQIYNTIALSSFIILLQNPDFLFDLGFQLSYSAVIGIIYFQPKIKGLLYVKSGILKWLWDLTSVSMAAQIGTLPLSVYYFNQFPNYFLLTNYIAIPISTFIIYVAVAFLVFHWIPFLSVAFAFVLKYLLFALNFTVGFIHDLPFAIGTYFINEWQLLLSILAILLFSYYGEYKRFVALAVALVVCFAFVFVDLHENYKSGQQKSIVVYADKNATHVNLISGKQNLVFSTDSASTRWIMEKYHRSRKLDKPRICSAKESYVLTFENKRILVLQDSMLHRKKSDQPLEFDYLILGNGIRLSTKDIFNNLKPKICIADQTISTRFADKLSTACRERNISFYYTGKQGAFICDFKQDNP